MEDLRDLYQEVILDHNKNPRNFHKMESATKVLDGQNPLCGDHYTLYLLVEDDIVKDISFEGAGCAISKASASLMSSILKGKSKEEVEEIFQLFHKVVTGEIDQSPGCSLQCQIDRYSVLHIVVIDPASVTFFFKCCGSDTLDRQHHNNRFPEPVADIYRYLKYFSSYFR